MEQPRPDNSESGRQVPGSEIPATQGESLLTGIPDAYTLSATHERSSEVDSLMVSQFLHALADVALAVASRKGNL